MKKLPFVLSAIILLSGCLASTSTRLVTTQQAPQITKTTTVQLDDQALTVQFIEKKGYTITANKGLLQTFVLEQKLLLETQYQQIWGVQEKEPDAFIDKEIAIYAFTVDNHPLEDIYDFDTNVYVMVAEGEVIGGYSSPDADEMLYGGAYGIDGKTREELKGLTYAEWHEQWTNKYGK
ncbi:hypothetical protein PAECIP111893_05230 [Paenibacillus plantiphilus]|uniref:Lipoprotein n=1 Tax=Paenibacillus plantiphilus TaxID=2905650 RepID=A0ABM9CX99_9BACL|nr:hypothetical protein [Paenibacillus plantiphilus]CAH1225180.1 hypothetical protein PAECIP111893_05230 [Paenibacillus plantiphilus]